MYWLRAIIIGFLAGAIAKLFIGGPKGFIITTLLGIVYPNQPNLNSPVPFTSNVAFVWDGYFPRLTAMYDGTGETDYSYVPTGALGALRLQQ